jgi:hypothetical protein
MGILEVNGPVPVIGPRFTALALMLGRNWAVTDLADALEVACHEHYPPTWDTERGEMTWDFGLGEPHPRGQYNATMAAADAMTEGAWWRLGNVSSSARFNEPTVCDVDFPNVALAQAEWDANRRQLTLTLQAMSERVVGQRTTLRVTGIENPGAFGATATDVPVESEVRDADLLIHTPVGGHAISVSPN